MLISELYGRKALIFVFGFSTLVACGPERSPEPPNKNTDGSEKPEIKEDIQFPPPTPKVALPACEAKEPSVCAGPLIGNVENVTLQWRGKVLSDGDREIQGTAALTIASRVPEQLQVALINQDILLVYSNGTTLRLNHLDDENVSGLSFCGFGGEACVNENIGVFSSIQPGDSPIRVDMKFFGRISKEEVPSLAKANTASLSVKLWVVHTDPAGNQQTVSIGGIPVTNSTVD